MYKKGWHDCRDKLDELRRMDPQRLLPSASVVGDGVDNPCFNLGEDYDNVLTKRSKRSKRSKVLKEYLESMKA